MAGNAQYSGSTRHYAAAANNGRHITHERTRLVRYVHWIQGMSIETEMVALQTELVHAERVRAYRARTGTVVDLDPIPAVLDPLFASSVIVLRDRGRGRIWLRVRRDVVVSACGSEPARFVGLSVARARHVARYGGRV